MDTLDYLARIGFDSILDGAGARHAARDEDDPASIEAARLADHAAVRAILLRAEAKSSPHHDGCAWLRLITWPDRVPGLKTWAGQQTLAKIIRGAQNAIEQSPEGDLFALRAPVKGASGLDALTAQDSLDIGFSPNVLDMAVISRPAVELLAIYGLETLPLVSYGPRECGFYHDGQLWRFRVASRNGKNYYHRWGQLRCHEDPRQQWAIPTR